MFTAEFLLTALVVVLVPGTGVIFTVSTSLARGRRAAIVASIGCTLGIVPHLVAAVLGISAILHLSALIFRIVRYFGAAYLFYLAYTMWRNIGSFNIESPAVDDQVLRTVGRAVLLNLLNPKLTLFFLAFLPQFLPPGNESPIASLISLGSVFMLMTFVVFVIYGLLAASVRHLIENSSDAMKWIQRSFSVALALFSIRLVLFDD